MNTFLVYYAHVTIATSTKSQPMYQLFFSFFAPNIFDRQSKNFTYIPVKIDAKHMLAVYFEMLCMPQENISKYFEISYT